MSAEIPSDFAFTVPQCAPGATLRLNASDGNTLELHLPAGADPGDEVQMTKSSGEWAFKLIVKKEGDAATTNPLPPTKSQAEVEKDLASPDVTTVRLETTKGPILMKLVPAWSPLGVKRFLQLVDDGCYKKTSIYRGIPNFLVQFGIVNDPKKNAKYAEIPDDPLRGVPYQDGMVGFAAGGPNTRTSTMCFFLGEAPHLGKRNVETPIGKICPESMKTLHALFLPGDVPQCGGNGPDPDMVAQLGNDYIKEHFPSCDFVLDAARVTTKQKAGAPLCACLPFCK